VRKHIIRWNHVSADLSQLCTVLSAVLDTLSVPQAGRAEGNAVDYERAKREAMVNS